MPSGSSVQPALWAASQTYPSASANAPLVPPHFSHGRMPDNRTSSSLGFVQHLGYFFNRTHVVRQLDPRSTMATERSPEAKDHPPA